MATTATAVDAERADLLAMLAKHRHFLRFTTRDLTDEEAGRRTTASELTLGGLIKHVTLVERNWADFLVTGPAAMAGSGIPCRARVTRSASTPTASCYFAHLVFSAATLTIRRLPRWYCATAGSPRATSPK